MNQIKRRLILLRFINICLIALSLAACSKKTIEANIKTSENTISYTLEVADTQQKLMKGLMYRKSMPHNFGMLFVFPPLHPQPIAMWMKNTYISLDMLFLNEEKIIIGKAEKTVPMSLKTIAPTKKKVSYVIELNSGEVQKHNIKIGNKVLF